MAVEVPKEWVSLTESLRWKDERLGQGWRRELEKNERVHLLEGLSRAGKDGVGGSERTGASNSVRIEERGEFKREGYDYWNY